MVADKHFPRALLRQQDERLERLDIRRRPIELLLLHRWRGRRRHAGCLPLGLGLPSAAAAGYLQMPFVTIAAGRTPHDIQTLHPV